MSERSPVWILPALAFAILVNGLLFFLLPLFTQEGTSFPGMPEPRAVHLVRVRDREPPPPEEQETPVPEIEEPKKIPEFFEPELFKPEVQPVEMDPVPFRIEINPRLMGGPQLSVKQFYDAGELDQPPRALVKMPPVYPYRAKRLEIEGFVRVKFLVDEEGAVSRISVLESSPQGVFEESVLQMLPSWRFSPGKVVGEPVPSWVVTTVRFELR